MGWSPSSFTAASLIFLSCAGAQPSSQPQSWQYTGPGQWSQAASRPATAPAVNRVLDHIQFLFDSRQHQATHDEALAWLLHNPKAPDRDRAVLLLAEAYFMLGDRMWCFYECDELLENYPDSRLFFQALELQYRVADAFLNGYKKLFLGLPIVPMEDTAVDMLFRIQERAPGSPVAEKSLLRTCEYYYKSSQFDLAADAYGAFVRIYPRSSATQRARLRQAHANFAQYRGPRYDATPLLDARAQFIQVQAMTPEMAQSEGVQHFIDRIDQQLAMKIFLDAEYYRGTRQFNGAVFLYRTVIQRYPNEPAASSARKALEKMPDLALATPPPPASAGQMPGPPVRPVVGPPAPR